MSSRSPGLKSLVQSTAGDVDRHPFARAELAAKSGSNSLGGCHITLRATVNRRYLLSYRLPVSPDVPYSWRYLLSGRLSTLYPGPTAILY